MRRLRGRHGHWVERQVVRQRCCVDTGESEGGELNSNGKSQARRAGDGVEELEGPDGSRT